MSPTLHNAAFAASGLDWAYVAFPVVTGQALPALMAMRVLGIDGFSVTMPHKTEMLAGCDSASDDSVKLGSINTIVRNSDDSLHGESTDGPGFIDALVAAGVDPVGMDCLILGAGGAGRAVILALARAGVRRIVVVNRSAERAAGAAALAPNIAVVGSADAGDSCSLIVNATPQGMGDSSALPIDLSRLGPGQVVNDLVYHPLETPLLRAAAAAGARPLGGLGMLLHQAGRQFTLWTGQAAPIEAMGAAIREVLEVRVDRGERPTSPEPGAKAPRTGS